MTTALRRTAVVGGTLIAAMAIGAPWAIADDVDEVLDRARESTYTATRLTVSVWGNQTQVIRERVEHSNGAEMIRIDETWSMVGNGRAIELGDAPQGVAFVTDTRPISTDRYVTGSTEPCRHMRRDCSLIPILEGGTMRAQMVVDERTGAPLITYVYDGQGRLYRTSSLSDFAPHRMYEWSKDPSAVPLEIVMHGESDALADSVAGYVLGDVFPGPAGAGSVQAYYSDGLFSYSLFVMPAATVVAGFEDADTLVSGSSLYSMVHTARDVRVQWSSGGERYVMMGDLPPDHLEAVLEELPQPEKRSMFARLWAKLFG